MVDKKRHRLGTIPAHPAVDWTRREFLVASSAGGGALLLSGLVGGCGGSAVKTAPEAAAAALQPSIKRDMNMGYFEAFGVDEALVRKVLGAAMAKGGQFADLFFQHNTTHYLGLQDGEVNRAFAEVELGCGIRVVKGDQTGFAFSEDLSEKALLDAAGTAAAVADGPSREIAASIVRATAPSHYSMAVSWDDVGIDKKIPFLNRANQKAFDQDPRIKKVQVYMSDQVSRVLVTTSDGAMVEDLRPMTTIYVTCVAEDKGRREENYHSFGHRKGFEFYSDAMIDELAREAARKTVVLFDAAVPPAGEYPVVLAPGTSGILLHEAIGHGMEADFNRKGISVYADKVGHRIAPEFVTIADDGTNPDERGSINIDDEGTQSEQTVLVENGILRSYMHDRISAAHYKVSPTGNGRRESYQYPPVPRMRNTYMMNGPHDPEEIIRSVKKGILAETFTNGQVHIGSGDFSFYLKNGYLIEDGKLTRPIKDANMIGFGPAVLEKVEMVGNDLKMSEGASTCGKDGQGVPVGMGLPTTKCGGISVGGVG
jgi:TldD protein